jgi:hypothetical protein
LTRPTTTTTRMEREEIEVVGRMMSFPASRLNVGGMLGSVSCCWGWWWWAQSLQ